MGPIVDLLLTVLQWYSYAIVIVAIMSWLIAFGVINIHNDIVRGIWNALNAITEPALRRIRNFLPAMGGLDLSPIVLLLLIWLVQMEIARYLLPLAYRY